jgi:uncharacterized protein involved in exopolysaccharide biosynthesis
MNFSELERIMDQKGIRTLADIARALNTSPQAISNWKSRDKVPYRIISIINELKNKNIDKAEQFNFQSGESFRSEINFNDKPFDYAALLITIFNNLKTLIFIPTISVLITLFYVFVIADINYVSSASILPTGGGDNSLSGINALASDFGISLGANQSDFSSSDMFPVILNSNTLAKNVIYANFKSADDNENSLFKIITNGLPNFGIDTLEQIAIEVFRNDIFSMNENRKSSLVTIYVRTFSRILSRDVAKIIINESDKLQTKYKTEKVNEKRKFIEERIKNVELELNENELLLKIFRENNRQINNSPYLLLEQEKLERETEVITNIFITLKQQYEMVKIEAVEKSTMLQILDHPEIPPRHDQPRRAASVLFSGFFGIVLAFGIVITKHSLDSGKKRKIKLLKKTLFNNLLKLIPFRKK